MFYNQSNPLQGFYESASRQHPVQKNMVNVDFNSMNKCAFKSSLATIGTLDEHSLAVLIKNNIDEITEDILTNRVPYANLFRDMRFISAFIRAISSIPVEYELKIACNKLAYDYFTSDNPDIEIKKQYLNISRVINRIEISKLVSIGLDENTACNLALSRYSSANEKTNVKRLNFSMYHRDANIMNEQMIIWIYEKMFNRISDLFYATMFEVYSPQEQDDFERSFGESFLEVYGTVGLSVLTILNNMTSENIRKVLLGYSEEWKSKNQPPVRFSLRSLSGDYSRITRVVEYLDSIGIFIP